MKYFWLWIFSAAVFCGLAFGFSVLLLDLPVEIRLRCRTARSVDLKIYPSRFLDRAIDGKHGFDAGLRLALPDPNTTGKVKIPLSSFRKIRLDVPQETEFELAGIDCRILGIWQQTLSGQELFSLRGSDGLELMPLLTPETEVPASLKFRTGKRPGSCEIRLVNDFPRFMALFFAIVSAAVLAGLPLLLTLNTRFRKIFKQYLYPSIFLFLLYGGTVIAALVSPPGDRSAGPKLDLSCLASYPDRFTRWYQRNLPFRNEIFNLHYRCCSLLGISPVEKVMAGQDGWLFIRQFHRQTPYEDYLGINLFTEDELKTILKRLEHARTLLRRKNIRFALFIAPGKMHVYGDRMKKTYQRRDPGGPTRAKQLTEYLRTRSIIPVEYPLDEIESARKQLNVPIYFKRDTHWNFCGAYIGARSMMRLIDRAAAGQMPAVSGMEPYYEETFYGDLARMTEAPGSCREPDWKFRNAGSFYQYLPREAGCYSLNGLRHGGPKVFFIRDSFLTHAMPHLIGRLSLATCYWDYSLNLKMIENDRPDIVVLEIVDRYLAELLNFKESDWQMRRGGKLL